ncbi:MAG: cobalamin-binding protein [Candidatus Ratteibacteria bacterium]|jgi:hypothetical protein
MSIYLTKDDCVGLIRSGIDAHTLGLISLTELLHECGYRSIYAHEDLCTLLNNPDQPKSIRELSNWILAYKITVLGYSWRLDPEKGVYLMASLIHGLKQGQLFREQGGPIRAICFGGLPRTCLLIEKKIREADAVFNGDESANETLERFGISKFSLPHEFSKELNYDNDRFSFGKEIVKKEAWRNVQPVEYKEYPILGKREETVLTRLEHRKKYRLPPLIRCHAGPFLPHREEAVRLFLEWTKNLAERRLLDILSIGISQRAQSNFGENWEDKPDGGGVPINSPEEFHEVWKTARPMLVRSYAGTKNIRAMAKMYERTIHIAWHALSLWWFSHIDGRGPYSVQENLHHHLDTFRYIAKTQKPYEPNISHHFAFRGSDDATSIAATVLAARTAKAMGIQSLILQVMLNTPRSIWGIQDLAKARATLQLIQPLEDSLFHTILQPRAGLNSLSPSPEKAMAQLAAATALMDDIEPYNPLSPPIIHVVSYSEGSELANPDIIHESIQITRHALEKYRTLRKKGEINDMSSDPELHNRTEELLAETKTILSAIDSAIPNPYSAEGLYETLHRGFFAVPHLLSQRDEFKKAVQWRTRTIRGSVKTIDINNNPISLSRRKEMLAQL